MILNVGIALFLFILTSKIKYPWFVGTITIVLAGSLLFVGKDSLDNHILTNRQMFFENKESRYGTLSVTEYGGQFSFYQNNLLLFSSDQNLMIEERVHFALLQHSNPENILAISGNVTELIYEVDKYPISSIDYLELDPSLMNLEERFVNIQNLDKKVNIIKQDPRNYLTKIDKKYDVILINLPDPENTQLNRYYTLDFFEKIKKNLSFSGVLSISLSGNFDYLSYESRYLHISLFSTLKLVFSDVIIIPGQRNYFLASEMPLSYEISKLVKARGILNKYVHPDYLDDEELVNKRDQINNMIGNNVLINYDFFPSLFSIKQNHWFQGEINIVYILLLVFIVIFIIIGRSDVANLGVFTTGFSAASLFFFILMVFQAIYGYVFFMLGIFISVYLIGLAFGLLILSKKIQKTLKNFSLIQYLLGIFSIIIPLIILKLSEVSTSGFILQTTFIIFVIGIGIVSGIQSTMSSTFRLTSIENNVRRTLGYDMIGNAIGYLIVPLLLIPLFGLIRVCLVVGILNFIVGLWLLIKMKISAMQ
jgi:spermidine synthase